MAKKKKFKGNNAQLVGETRLTQREMKKMKAAFHNVQRDNQALAANFAAQRIAHEADIGGVAKLGDIDG